MSKFLKIITRLILILLILCGIALLVPPFFGMNTVIVENQSTSNLSRGTVAYVKSVNTDSIKAGDKIVRVTEDESVNVYRVSAYDKTSRTITATKSDRAAEEQLHASDSVRKLLITVPFLGYLSLSTRSFSGLLIFGGSLLILIILMIIAEVLGSDKEELEVIGGEQEDVEFFSTLNEKKTEEFDAQKLEHAQNAQDTQNTPKNQGEMDEAQPADDFPVEGEGEDFIQNLKGEVSGRKESQDSGIVNTGAILGKAEKPAPDESDVLETDGLPNVQAALEAVLDGRQVAKPEAFSKEPSAKTTDQVLKTGEVELAMPVHTAEEYLDRAHGQGDDPELIEDPVTGIKFVDYTDCL